MNPEVQTMVCSNIAVGIRKNNVIPNKYGSVLFVEEKIFGKRQTQTKDIPVKTMFINLLRVNTITNRLPTYLPL